MRKNASISKKHIFLHDEDILLTLIVFVLMTAALAFSVILYLEKNGSHTSAKNSVFEEYLSNPETAELPLIRIWTDDGERPTFSEAEMPEASLGATITNNEYKMGYCTIESISSMPRFASEMKIKVRGNATAVGVGTDGKLPYKLVLDIPVDLFEDGAAETKFILLAGAGTNLKTWLGLHIGELCGIEWTLRTRYVNLVLNDEYQGLYLLTEAKDGSSLREHVGDGGFLIESDGYYWKEDVFFRSAYLEEQSGYTVKFPEITDKNDNRLTEIKAYIEWVEKNILQGNLEYIDLDSFCAWIIAKDILYETDAAGSNVYFYLYDMSEREESTEQLKMGPLWDFDSTFGEHSVSNGEVWSAYHGWRSTYFVDLFQNAEFINEYCGRMTTICGSLYDLCSDHLASLCDELEGPINASREADARRWGKDWRPLREEAEDRLQWLSDRVAWIGSELVPVTKKNGEIEYRQFILDVSEDSETLTISLYDDGYERVRFPTWSDENGQDDVVWYDAELNEDLFWEAAVPLYCHPFSKKNLILIHAYATKNGEEAYVKGGSVYAGFDAKPTLTAALSDDGQSMTITFRDDGYDQVQFPIWSDDNEQDDIVWYNAKLDTSGNWTVTVDLQRHKPGDEYTIHVYATKDRETIFVDGTHVG